LIPIVFVRSGASIVARQRIVIDSCYYA